MRDGVRLATDIYGADDGVPKPVLLLRTPYDKQGGATTARRYAAAGYVAAVQDSRGAFASEGQYFHHNNDDQDGFDTIEWLARQPWSNGKTGTWGGSHPGAVQWLAAGERPYGLTVIAPTAASASLYYTAYVGGALRLALIGGAGPAITKPPAGKKTPEDLAPFYRTLPLADLDKAIGWDMPWMRGMVTHPWLDGFWTRQHASERVKGLDLPAQHIVGYYAFLCKETVASFQRMRKFSGTERARSWERVRRSLPGWVMERLAVLRPMLAPLDEQIAALGRQLEADAPAGIPRGLGKLTSVVLTREVCDWGRFKNRRQVASYTGLCPGEYSSGGKRIQGSVTKHGNPRLRAALVELAWRLVRLPLRRLRRVRSAYRG